MKNSCGHSFIWTDVCHGVECNVSWATRENGIRVGHSDVATTVKYDTSMTADDPQLVRDAALRAGLGGTRSARTA